MTQISFKKQRIKTASGRKISSTLWLQRHVNDRYVVMAKKAGYRSRAAFKILQIDEKFHLFRQCRTIVDLGAAPGSWLQVAQKHAPRAKIIGIDLKSMEALPGVSLLEGDFCDPANQELIRNIADGAISLVMSDMAANACGDRQIDHLRIMDLVHSALTFALANLEPGGVFVSKVLRGGEEEALLREVRRHFAQAKFYKPNASYDNSAESFIVATGFRGGG